MSRTAVLAYCPLPYNGHGWVETCVQLLRHDGPADITLIVPRTSRPVPGLRVVEALPPGIRQLPWRLCERGSQRFMVRALAAEIARAEPSQTIAYFWPGTGTEEVATASAAGLLTARQMINTYQGTAKRVLDESARRWATPSGHAITEDAITAERSELARYDVVVAANEPVADSLLEAGVAPDHILRSSFGWDRARFGDRSAREDRHAPTTRPRFLFVGLVGARKGIPALLAAWRRADLDGDLVMVGAMQPEVASLMAQATDVPGIHHVDHSSDVGSFYRAADAFVLPTLEEGGPQVTLEAAAFGLPVVTTAMGTAGLVRDGVNGLVVTPDDVNALTAALRALATDESLRHRLSARIRHDAEDYAYDRVGPALVSALGRLRSAPWGNAG